MLSLPYCFIRYNMCVLILLHVDLNNFYVTKIIYVKSFRSVKFRVILLCVYWCYVCMAFSWHLLPASVTGYVYWSLINVCTEPHTSDIVLTLATWYAILMTVSAVLCNTTCTIINIYGLWWHAWHLLPASYSENKESIRKRIIII